MTVRRVVVDHVLFVAADLDASRGLYTAALAPLGYEELYVQDDCVSYGAEDLDDFTICRGEPVTTAAHVAFSAEGRDAVDAFFAAAVANGATVRGEPGVWTQYSEGTTPPSLTTCTRTTSRLYGTHLSQSPTRPVVRVFPKSLAARGSRFVTKGTSIGRRSSARRMLEPRNTDRD
jgi:catechol 2,3-dioxygenase-like lactoylglutathione lyase family enzyme